MKNFKFLVLITLALIGFQLSAQTLPEPVGYWQFDENNPLVDKSKSNNFGTLTLKGGAKITNEGLVVTTNQWAEGVYQGTKAIKEKTLLAKATIKSLTGAGSILTIDHINVDIFDGIVLGESRAGQWIAGSNRHSRSNLSNKFTEKVGETVIVAITYKEVNGKCQVAIYQNGNLLETYSKGNLATYQKDVKALFGTRHILNGKALGFVSATIEAAVIFDVALDAATIKTVVAKEMGHTIDISSKVSNTILMQNIRKEQRVGQTFTSINGGALKSISVKFGKGEANGGLLAFDLYEVQADGSFKLFAKSNLAGYGWDGTINKRVYKNVTLKANTKYAFLCRNGGWNTHPVEASDKNPYSGGNAFFSKTNAEKLTSVQHLGSSDLWFEVEIE